MPEDLLRGSRMFAHQMAKEFFVQLTISGLFGFKSTPVNGNAVFQTVAVVRLPLNPVGVTKRLTAEKTRITL